MPFQARPGQSWGPSYWSQLSDWKLFLTENYSTSLWFFRKIRPGPGSTFYIWNQTNHRLPACGMQVHSTIKIMGKVIVQTFPRRAWQNKPFFMAIYVVTRMTNSFRKHGKFWQKTELGGYAMLAEEICQPQTAQIAMKIIRIAMPRSERSLVLAVQVYCLWSLSLLLKHGGHARAAIPDFISCIMVRCSS